MLRYEKLTKTNFTRSEGKKKYKKQFSILLTSKMKATRRELRSKINEKIDAQAIFDLMLMTTVK